MARAVIRRRSPDALEGPDDREVDVQLVAERRQVAARVPDRLREPQAVDHAQGARAAQVVRDGLGDARRQPGELAVRADVREVQHRDCGRARRSSAAGDARAAPSRGEAGSTGAMKR